MFFTLEKLERSTKKLKDLRYRERIEIPAFDASTPEEEPVGKRPESVVYTGTLKKGDFWTGRGTYMWIRQIVEIPAEWAGKKIAGLFNMGKTGDGLNSGFEGLIYVNGSPYCETGSYHEEVIFPTELAGTKVELAIRLWACPHCRRTSSNRQRSRFWTRLQMIFTTAAGRPLRLCGFWMKMIP